MTELKRTEKLVLEQITECRRLQRRILLRDVGQAVGVSVGTVFNILARLRERRLLKDAPYTVVEVGPQLTSAGELALQKGG